MAFLLFMVFFVSVVLFVANLCYIKELERQIEILEVKLSALPLSFVVDEASLSLNDIRKEM